MARRRRAREESDPDDAVAWCPTCADNTLHSITRQACRHCEIRAHYAERGRQQAEGHAARMRSVEQSQRWSGIGKAVGVLVLISAVGWLCSGSDKPIAPAIDRAPMASIAPPIDYAKLARDAVADRAHAAVVSDMDVGITDTDGPDTLEVLAAQGTCNRALLTKVRARLKQRGVLDDALGAGFVSLACSVDPAQLALDEKVKLPANQPGADVGPAKTGPHCVKGCPCGNSCISCSKSCEAGPGTAWK